MRVSLRASLLANVLILSPGQAFLALDYRQRFPPTHSATVRKEPPLRFSNHHHAAKRGSATRSYRQVRLRAFNLPNSSTSTYLVRICFLRALAFVHLVAFWVAFRQNKGLIGDQSITPARYILDQAEMRGAAKEERRLVWRNDMELLRLERGKPMKKARELSPWRKFQRAIGKLVDSDKRLRYLRQVLWDRCDQHNRPLTTLLWLAKDRQNLNSWLDGVALVGIVAAGFILYRGAANVPLMFVLWLLQKSIMNVGGLWYGYGWEPQLAELSFHAMFIVPLLSLDPIPSLPLSPLVQWAIKWHLFRVMMGAGLIKLRSNDPKWKNLTAMCYFYETQPVPNPMTRYMHWMPKCWHKLEVLTNHFVELVAPWLLIIPGLPVGWRRAGGIVQLVFQIVLICTGNFSFLNWLTMVPAILCLDDAMVQGLFAPRERIDALLALGTNAMPLTRKLSNVLFASLIAILSVPVVRNLLSKKQEMIASYDPLRLVNSFGAFGRVEEERIEWIISASADLDNWKEYEFKVKPGRLDRIPRFISPYHHRLDWQMWLAANLRHIEASPWLYVFLAKLLRSDSETVKLIEYDPFEGSMQRPKFIRIDAYNYKFHRPRKDEKQKLYWDRTFVRRVFPRDGLATLQDLKRKSDRLVF